MVKVGNVYRHYSGKMYEVLQVARYSENSEQLFVVYRGLYDCPSYGQKPVWCRDLSMFTEMVEVNGVKQPRFAEYIE